MSRQEPQFLILDGITCALIGAHLPWSEIATAILDMEAPGKCSIFGWKKVSLYCRLFRMICVAFLDEQQRTGPSAAALIKSTSIQGFELDDFHYEAHLHCNAIVLPSLFSAAEQTLDHASSDPVAVEGASLLIATIISYEVGPRVGLGL